MDGNNYKSILEVTDDQRRKLMYQNEKSTVCILKPYGEIVSKPFEVYHVEQELSRIGNYVAALE